MGQVLYRKYRSRSFDDVVGQEHITDTLTKAIKKGAIGHAYLFTGPRGTGKTSIARILAYTVNDVEYSDDPQLDIIEIDAASNRRIDEIRELRDTVNLVPSQLKYKVYIIDEVHMLTREAFNALLKTLEEPPEHALFILATTELQKVPETIVSRCQRFTFKHISNEHIISHLKNIAKQEDIEVEDEALEIIAEHSRGSFRDALSLLDQLSSLGSKVSMKDTRAVIGLSSDEIVEQLINEYRSQDMVGIITAYRSAIDEGSNPLVLAAQISAKIRSELNQSVNSKRDLELLKSLLTLHTSRHPEALLEIILLEGSSVQATAPKPPIENPKPTKPVSSKKDDKPKKKKEDVQDKAEPEEASEESDSPHSDLVIIAEEHWQKVLNQIKLKRNTLYGILRMAKTEIASGEVDLHFAFPFHVKRASDSDNKKFLEQTIRTLGLKFSRLDIHHSPDKAKPAEIDQAEEEAEEQTNTIPDSVLDVFSGAEIMEA